MTTHTVALHAFSSVCGQQGISRTRMNRDFCITKMSVRFKSLTAVLHMAALFWDVTPCCWVSSLLQRHCVSQSDCVFHRKKVIAVVFDDVTVVFVKATHC